MNVEWLRRFYYDFCYKVGISYGMVFICYHATRELLQSAKTLGFGATYEGRGLP